MYSVRANGGALSCESGVDRDVLAPDDDGCCDSERAISGVDAQGRGGIERGEHAKTEGVLGHLQFLALAGLGDVGKGLHGVDADAVVKDDQRVAVNDNLDSRGLLPSQRSAAVQRPWSVG